MKSKILSCIASSSLLLGTASLQAAETTLNAKAEGVKKEQVLDSMMGYRDTLLFYTFAAEKAVLVVNIGNKSDKFPMTAKLHIFAKEATAEGLSNWINNQHSDGLFPEVPKPTATHEFPATSCVVVTNKIIEAKKAAHNGTFNHYSVDFKIENVPAFGVIKIKDFTDTASVNVKIDGEG
jgi:hypothetical protein